MFRSAIPFFYNSFIDTFTKQLSFKVFSFKFCSLANKPDVVELLHEAVKGKLGETNKARVTVTVAVSSSSSNHRYLAT